MKNKIKWNVATEKKTKKIKEVKEEPIIQVFEEKVTCKDCGIYFDLRIARDRQYDWNKYKQEVVCPCCKSMYERE